MNKKLLLRLLLLTLAPITLRVSSAHGMQDELATIFPETICEENVRIPPKSTLLISAIKSNNLSEAKTILAYAYLREGYNKLKNYVNKIDAYGATALHYAVQNQTNKIIQVIEILLAEGADPNAQDFNNKTPLNWCLENSYCSSSYDFIIKVIACLEKYGATKTDPDINNITRLTLLKETQKN